MGGRDAVPETLTPRMECPDGHRFLLQDDRIGDLHYWLREQEPNEHAVHQRNRLIGTKYARNAVLQP